MRQGLAVALEDSGDDDGDGLAWFTSVDKQPSWSVPRCEKMTRGFRWAYDRRERNVNYS